MKQKGFTLIELMIVVAIIGLLAVITAVSMYQENTTRSRVTEGLVLASSAKDAVAETTMTNNRLPPDQTSTGYTSPAATVNVASIVIGANGVVTITYTPTAGSGTIVLVPSLTANGDVTWDCTGGTLIRKYRPTICRP